MRSSVIQARVDLAAKKEAEAVLARLGITLSDGIRLFISQVAIDRGLPFRPKLGEEPNMETIRSDKRSSKRKTQ